MKLIALALGLLLIGGCAGKVKPDPVWPPPIDAGYPTAEVWACGRLQNLGHGLCSIEEGKPYSDAKLELFVYYKGTVKIATNCGLDSEFNYEGTKKIPIVIPGIASSNCLVTVTVQPKFPNEEDEGVKIYSLRGHVVVRVLKKGEKWEGSSHKITGNFSDKNVYWVGKQSDVEVNFVGCGIQPYKKTYDASTGLIEVRLDDVIPTSTNIKTCVLSGYIRSKIYKDLLLNYLVSIYDIRFTPLPIPSVEIDGDKLLIVADDAVSAISVNGEYKLASEGKFKFDKTQVNIVRVLTASGRSAVGIWKQGTWTWTN